MTGQRWQNSGMSHRNGLPESMLTWVRRIRFLNSWRKPIRSTKLVCLRPNDNLQMTPSATTLALRNPVQWRNSIEP